MMSESGSIAVQARMSAQRALDKIEGHEAECNRREAIIDRRFEEMKASIASVRALIESRNTVIWTIAGSCLVAAISGLFQLVRTFVHP